MLRRFISYYRPYKGLFILDITTAVLHSGFTLCIPYLVRNMLKYDLPAGDLNSILFSLAAIFVLIVLMCVTIYVNTRWGHFLGTRIEADMRSDLFRHLQKLSYWTSSVRCRTDSTRSSASTASSCPAARSSASRSPASS